MFNSHNTFLLLLWKLSSQNSSEIAKQTWQNEGKFLKELARFRKGLYDGMPCDFRMLGSKIYSSWGALLYGSSFTFYSSVGLELVLLMCFILCFVCVLLCSIALQVSVCSCIFRILELFDSKNCPKPCTLVALQSCRLSQWQGNFFCKGIRVLAHAANCPGSGVATCSDFCAHTHAGRLRATVMMWRGSNVWEKTFWCTEMLWHRTKAESHSRDGYRFVDDISLVNFVWSGLMPGQVWSCSLHSNFVLDQLPSVLLQLA